MPKLGKQTEDSNHENRTYEDGGQHPYGPLYFHAPGPGMKHLTNVVP